MNFTVDNTFYLLILALGIRINQHRLTFKQKNNITSTLEMFSWETQKKFLFCDIGVEKLFFDFWLRLIALLKFNTFRFVAWFILWKFYSIFEIWSQNTLNWTSNQLFRYSNSTSFRSYLNRYSNYLTLTERNLYNLALVIFLE
jgi:hypothetical protein